MRGCSILFCLSHGTLILCSKYEYGPNKYNDKPTNAHIVCGSARIHCPMRSLAEIVWRSLGYSIRFPLVEPYARFPLLPLLMYYFWNRWSRKANLWQTKRILVDAGYLPLSMLWDYPSWRNTPLKSLNSPKGETFV